MAVAASLRAQNMGNTLVEIRRGCQELSVQARLWGQRWERPCRLVSWVFAAWRRPHYSAVLMKERIRL